MSNDREWIKLRRLHRMDRITTALGWCVTVTLGALSIVLLVRLDPLAVLPMIGTAITYFVTRWHPPLIKFRETGADDR